MTSVPDGGLLMDEYDDLLARIGAAVLERVDEGGVVYAGPKPATPKCPACGVEGATIVHTDDCPITEALEHE